STYASFMLMYLDENDHVQYLTLHPYSDPKQVMAVRAVEEHLSKLDRAAVKMIEQMGRKHYAVKWWQYDIEVGAIPADSPRPVQN
ncbi:MAG TPA: hypothetical protein V6C65_14155, partial [Allocoleopsis sp.]